MGKKKLKLADPFDALDKESIKRLRQKQEDNSEENDEQSGGKATTATEETAEDAVGGPHPNTLLSETEKDSLFLTAAVSAFEAMAKRGDSLKLNNMLNDLKKTGLYEYVVKKHGGVTKFFLGRKEFGVTVDYFVSMQGHCGKMVHEARLLLGAAPKKMMKLQDFEAKLKTKLSENIFRSQVRGYPDFIKCVEAHRHDFAVDKKKIFVKLQTPKT